jgi:hypothetical protein
MARSFNGTTDKLQANNGSGVTFPTFSMTSFVKPTGVTLNMRVAGISRSISSPVQEAVLIVAGAVAGDPASFLISDTGVNRQASSTSTSMLAGVWQTLSATNASIVSHTSYLNGGGAVANTVSVSPTNSGMVTQIGCGIEASVDAGFYGGDACEVAFFDEALSARQQVAIGAGACPLLVSGFVSSYWPLWPGNTGNELGLVRGKTLTATGTSSARHGPVFARHTGGV